MIYFRTIFYAIFVIFNININAQCSMCRAVAESSQSGGSSIADGLNTGILYLMMFPYLLLIYALIRLYFRDKKQT